jgi:hypothetical protein
MALMDIWNQEQQLTPEQFMAADPAERKALLDYIQQSWMNGGGSFANNPDLALSMGLMGINQGFNGPPVSPETLTQLLSSSGVDPSRISSILSNQAQQRQRQEIERNDNSLTRHALLGAAAFGGVGALGTSLAAAPAAAGGATAAAPAATGMEGLTAADMGLEALPWTTNPSLAELGGVIDSATGLPVAAQAGAGGGLSQLLKGPAGNAAGTAAGSAIGRILRGEGTMDDYLAAGGTGLATGLGIYGSGQQADAIRDISNQARADRAPFLGAATNYLQNPTAYAEGPGKVFMDATLRGLSAKVGNPIDNPTALGLATQAGLSDWRNAVLGFGNLGLAGEDTRANLGVQAAGADANQLNALGYGIGELTNPKPKLTDLLRGGMKVSLA